MQTKPVVHSRKASSRRITQDAGVNIVLANMVCFQKTNKRNRSGGARLQRVRKGERAEAHGELTSTRIHFTSKTSYAVVTIHLYCM